MGEHQLLLHSFPNRTTDRVSLGGIFTVDNDNDNNDNKSAEEVEDVVGVRRNDTCAPTPLLTYSITLPSLTHTSNPSLYFVGCRDDVSRGRGTDVSGRTVETFRTDGVLRGWRRGQRRGGDPNHER